MILDSIADFLKNLYKNPIAISFVTSSIVTILFQTITKGFINNVFKKQLEKYKDKINQHAEERKLDFERKIHDFSLYSKKRHELYPEIYKKIYMINYHLSTYGEQAALDKSFIGNKDEILPYYHNIGLVLDQKLQDFIVNKCENEWDIDSNFCLIQISKQVKIWLFSLLRTEIEDANEFFRGNILFISVEAAKKIEKLFAAFSFLYEQELQPKNINEEDKIDKILLQQDIDNLREIMVKELGVGDYKSGE
ncbi:hypothetical protein [Heyndrickxia faecalis]|uniref:hypothetical protein n=1 Tax=Heyndrickxia faecalis TaxID=2824910 RepID=UPI003D1B3BA3